MKKHLLLLLLTLLPMVASADAVEIDGIYYNLIPKGNTAEVTSNPNKYTNNIEIPSSITYEGVDYSVTSIGESAFEGCVRNLTSVTIPNSVTSIGDKAFYNCRSLTSLTIPNSVTSINKSTFAYCRGLTSVTIPNSVKSIGNAAFHSCSGLTSVTIPNSLTTIGDSAFYGCSGLTSVIIPNSVTSINKSTFRNCSGLSSVTIPNSVKSIGDAAFYGCSGLTSVTIPNSVTNIGLETFYDCYGLTSITIPNSVMSIGESAFCECGLVSVTIGNGVTSIEAKTFANCTNLTTITIPSSVKNIYGGAFYGCKKISSVYITDLAAWCNISFLDDTSLYGYNKSYATPFYCDNEHHLYLNGKELTNLDIPQDAIAIHEKAFYNCKSITSVTIPNSVTSIGNYAFLNCSGLVSVTIGNSVTSIGSGAFNGCNNLLTVKSEITEPFNCWERFSNETLRKGTLYVPAGTKDLYIRFDGWREFLKIEEVGAAISQQYLLSFVVDNKELSTRKVDEGATITPPTKDNNGNTISWYTYPTTMPAHDLVVYGMVVKKPEPEVFVWLTVNDCQSGYTKIKVKQGAEQTLNFMAEEGWKISNIFMDGRYVTSRLAEDGTFVTPAITGDASIIVVYEEITPSGVRAATRSLADVKVVSDGVVISDAEPDTRCVVYQTDGKQVVNTVINEGTRKITLQKGLAYILTIDGRTLKFAL